MFKACYYSDRIRLTTCKDIYSIWVGCEIQSPWAAELECEKKSTKIKMLCFYFLTVTPFNFTPFENQSLLLKSYRNKSSFYFIFFISPLFKKQLNLIDAPQIKFSILNISNKKNVRKEIKIQNSALNLSLLNLRSFVWLGYEICLCIYKTF